MKASVVCLFGVDPRVIAVWTLFLWNKHLWKRGFFLNWIYKCFWIWEHLLLRLYGYGFILFFWHYFGREYNDLGILHLIEKKKKYFEYNMSYNTMMKMRWQSWLRNWSNNFVNLSSWRLLHMIPKSQILFKKAVNWKLIVVRWMIVNT